MNSGRNYTLELFISVMVLLIAVVIVYFALKNKGSKS
jgi:hypothetical protein